MIKFIQSIVHIVIVICISTSTIFSQVTFRGSVSHGITGEPLAGATVFIPELKIGTSSNKDGQFVLANLPAQKFLLQVRFIGYQVLIHEFDLNKVMEFNFKLYPSVLEGKEIVITGSPITTPLDQTSISIVSMEQPGLTSPASANIIDALAHTPGISQITSGGAISKPVIRGLSHNRIVVLNEGIRQEGQQWGDEHGIEIDRFTPQKVEIIKGPASLFYGSDALGGVINFLEPAPVDVNTLKATATSQFSTHDVKSSNSVMLAGNKGGVFGRIRASYINAGPYSNPLFKVANTGFSETNLSSSFGINRKWGYSHLNFSRYNARIGIYDDERTATHRLGPDQAFHESEHGDSRSPGLPLQDVIHNKISSNNRIILGKTRLSFSTGIQSNSRKEFTSSLNIPSVAMDLNSATADIKIYLPVVNKWESVIGIGSMFQNNQNKGLHYLIPDYDLVDFGSFVFGKRTEGKTTTSLGLRIDNRSIKSNQLLLDSTGAVSVSGSDTVFHSIDKVYNAFSGAIGFVYKMTHAITLKTNIGKGFRAPGISELSANGVHEGTFRYEKGNTALKPETGFMAELNLSAELKRITVELSGFSNHIRKYIYQRNLNSELTVVGSDTMPLYRFIQGNGMLNGFELSFDWHIIENVHFENAVSYVKGQNTSTNTPLPFMPPFLMHNEVGFEIQFIKSKIVKNPHVEISFDNHFGQKRIDEFETVSAPYSLLNAELDLEIWIGKQKVEVSMGAANLFNTVYTDHLSRLKYQGVPNRGRSFTFGLHLPVGIIKL
jgi:iron complex outermembrane recepter protein